MYHIFIVNPTAGNNNGLKVGKAIEEFCEINHIEYDVIYTTSKEEIAGMVKQYSFSKDVVIYSVGGDGTLNEVVNAMNGTRASLSVIPAGTGNDFYKSLKDFYGDKIDLGKVNDRYFINIASIGLDAEVADGANKLKSKKLPNKLIYILSLIKTFFTYRNINISVDGVKMNSTIFTLCNGRYYGGGFEIAPKARLNNGKFDVIEVESINKLKMINLMFKLLKGKHLESPHVNLYNSSKINIKSDVPITCNIDGEIIKDTSFDFSIEREAIKYSNDTIEVCKYLRKQKLIK